MPASAISLESAKPDKLFYFVANAVVVRRSDMRCLILKRHDREKVHPGLYAVPGGKLEWQDLDIKNPTRLNGDVLDYENAIESLLRREVREEAGIEIETQLHYINSVVFIRPDGIPVVLAKFAAAYKSGEVVLEKDAFTDFAWVNSKEVLNYPTIKGINDEVEAAIRLLS